MNIVIGILIDKTPLFLQTSMNVLYPELIIVIFILDVTTRKDRSPAHVIEATLGMDSLVQVTQGSLDIFYVDTS